MQQYIPFLLAILYYAYKVYSNFQKEQEKAKIRNPGKRPEVPTQPATARTREVVRKELKSPQPFLLEEVIDPTKPYEPQYKHIYKEEKLKEVAAKAQGPKKTVPKRVELYNPEIASEEVARNRAIHKPHAHGWNPHHEEELHYEFDFKDAIIKEAILNRPKY